MRSQYNFLNIIHVDDKDLKIRMSWVHNYETGSIYSSLACSTKPHLTSHKNYHEI